MKIVFLLYINRSGSTYLCQELSKYDDILVCPEADILADLLLIQPNKKPKDVAGLLKQFSRDEKFSQWGIEPEKLSIGNKDNYEVFKNLLKAYRKKVKPNAETIIYKAERLFQLKNVLASSQDTRFIWLIRDLRAVYHSQKSSINPQTGNCFSLNPVATALYWNSYIKTLTNHQYKSAQIIHFENLISNYPDSIDNIIRHLEIDLQAKLAEGDLFQRISKSHLELHKNITNPPDISRISEWQDGLSDKEKCLLEISSHRFLHKLDYDCLILQKKKNKLYMVFFFEYTKYHITRIKNKILFHIVKLFHV